MQKHFESQEKLNDQEHVESEMNLINQWVPVTENSIVDVIDADKRLSFENELSEIKNELILLKEMDMREEDTISKINKLYKRTEILVGEVGIYFEEKNQE